MSADSKDTIKTLISRFTYKRVLNSNPQFKVISLLGSIDGKNAILTVEKTHFMFEENIEVQQQKPSIHNNNNNRSSSSSSNNNNKETRYHLHPHPHPYVHPSLLNQLKAESPPPLYYHCENEYSCVQGLQDIKQITSNDVYYWGIAVIKQDLHKSPTARINLIWPANYIHIKRFDQQNLHFVIETPAIYMQFVKPYIDEQVNDNQSLKWVYQILYEGSDNERVIYKEDDDKERGFLILPDTRWDGVNIETLYLVALVYRDDIRSLRDLKPVHRDWLIELNRKIRSIVPACYNFMVHSDELRIFIHYQPSYYHFHLHIINIRYPAGNEGLTVGKAVLLEDAIEALTYSGPDGYMERIISYSISENHDLWKRGLESANQQQFDTMGIPRTPEIRK